MKKILELKNISLTYFTPQNQTQALKNITFDIKQGEFVSIVGPSGCGKTTILSIIANIIKPTSGEVKINTSNQKACGYMFQRDLLFEWRTIQQNIMLGLETQKIKNYENINYVKDLASKYGLKDFLNHTPSQLSGGMRQRVALIRTLALRPDILLLDEPFSALDFQTRLNACDNVHEIIKKENKTAILVTHDISEAISMSDRIFVLSNRPAQIKSIFTLEFNQKLTPFERRKQPNFSKYFNDVWQEMEGTQNEKI